MGSGSDSDNPTIRRFYWRDDESLVNGGDINFDDDTNSSFDPELTSELSALTELISDCDSGDTFDGERSCRRAVSKVNALANSSGSGQETPSNVPPFDDRDPVRIGPYRLIAKLGEGGMGRVYRARHESLDRTIALKILLPDRAKRSASASRFRREVRALGKLNHPNIVAATDGGIRDGVQFLAMELVSGVNLSQVLSREGSLSIPNACELTRQAATGLAAAHANGMVHRDVKPSNLMLTVGEAGQPIVKILDLGLALDADRSEFTDELTSTGQIVGTMAYMAPEQITDGHQVDFFADIYSLGATLAKLLCGRTPFDLESNLTPVQTLVAKSSIDAQSIKQLRHDLPTELVDLIDQSLKLRPEQRPSDAKEFATRLQPYAKHHDLVSLFNRNPMAPETPLISRTDLAECVLSAAGFALDDEGAGSVQNERKQARNRRSRQITWLVLAMSAISLGMYALFSSDADNSDHPGERNRSTAASSVEIAKIGDDVDQMMWDITSSLVSYWPIRSQDGDVLVDYSGNGLHAKISSNRSAVNRSNGATLLGDRTCIDVSKLDHPIAIAHDARFNMDQITVSAWIRGKPSQGLTYRLISKTNKTDGFALSLGGQASNRSGRAFFNAMNQKGNAPSARSGNFVLDGSWHHLAGTCNGRELCVYVDGVLSDTVEMTNSFGVNDKSLLIGVSRDEDILSTEIDEIVICNRVLTAGEIRFLTAHTLTPHPLVAPADAVTVSETQHRWREYLNQPLEIENSLGATMTYLPPGEFTMGSSEEYVNELISRDRRENLWDRFRSESPAHRVQFRNSIYFGTHEITQQQYVQIMGENPSQFSGAGERHHLVDGMDTNDYPVENVSWFDAIKFCNRLSELEGLQPCYQITDLEVSMLSGEGYRLPTEAEWEYACRAGTLDPWSYGSGKFSDYEWSVNSAPKLPQPIGRLAPNPFGLYDMHGNVFEWCYDWYAADAYSDRSASITVDPKGPMTGSRRVFRGGSWWQRRTSSRSAFRGNHFPHFVMNEHGFRVVRSINSRK
tara:strand:+ start:17730 stop:20792 length:3063 start_codon:yes stop_codon:yes gene_type:complete